MANAEDKKRIQNLLNSEVSPSDAKRLEIFINSSEENWKLFEQLTREKLEESGLDVDKVFDLEEGRKLMNDHIKKRKEEQQRPARPLRTNRHGL
jgi:hypothetical protein